NDISSIQRTRLKMQTQRQGTELAQSLTTEIMQAYYIDPGASPTFGPETGESTGNRSLFDDVDDYSAWSESPPKDKGGNAVSGYTGWSRSATIAWADPTNPGTTSATDQGLKRIAV